MRNAVRFTGLFLVALTLAATGARAQEHSAGGDSDRENAGPKHYLTFQVGYRGTASKVVQNEFQRSETKIKVSNLLSGRIEAYPTESRDLAANGSVEAQLKRAEAMRAAMLAGDVEKWKQETPPLRVTWYPRGSEVEITGKIAETMQINASKIEVGESRASSDSNSESYEANKVFAGNFVNAFVKIRAEEKLYDIQFNLMPDMESTWEAVRYIYSKEHTEAGNNKHSKSEANLPLDAGPSGLGLGYSNYAIAVDVKNLPLAGEANELIGNTRIPVPKPAGWTGAWDIGLDVSWQIDVSLPPLELVITAPGYEKWRPEGNIPKPTEPGNKLVARATLKPKEGQGKFVPRVKSIRFQLLDTSREPGICLNWPLEAKDDDYDLRLADVSGGTLSKNDQLLEVTDPKRNDEGQHYAEVQIDSYDFGGRASLRAVCLLADGREIEGVMKSEGVAEEMPRLPKMKSPGWIADSWRKANQAEALADDDDNEKVDGQKDNGDGFTLYEEYRGWVENGKRLEGDPKRKDFFVLNLFKNKADAQPGINLFEAVSKLRVHSQLGRSEMSEVTRLMNGNRRDAPRNVEQHGVWVNALTGSDLGANGAFTPLTKKGVAGRPGITKGVGILPRGEPGSIFDQAFNLQPSDMSLVYDRAIAHELLHSVGVEHHGSKDDIKIDLLLIFSKSPENLLGRPYFVTTDGVLFKVLTEENEDVAAIREKEVSVIVEQAKKDLLSSYLPKAHKDFARDKGYGVKSKYATPEAQAEAEFYHDQASVYAMHGLIGVWQGTHSGEQNCLMRYYFAKFYQAQGRSETLYVSAPGTERIGIDICHAVTGTGINAPDRKPQSRYGNAAKGAGDCFNQICPNDAIPPRSVK